MGVGFQIDSQLPLTSILKKIVFIYQHNFTLKNTLVEPLIAALPARHLYLFSFSVQQSQAK